MKKVPMRKIWYWLGFEDSPWQPLDGWLLVLVVGLFLWAGRTSVNDLNQYPGIDLRNRVVGARLLLAGQQPYTFQWHEGMPVEWLDPMTEPRLHRLTISPFELLFYVPMASWPYRHQRLFHGLCEWLALVGTLVLLNRWLSTNRQRMIFLTLAGIFVVSGDIWRFHVERGQIYVFHLLLLALGFHWLRRNHLNSRRAGVAFGLSVLLRPSFLVLFPALALLGKWRTLMAACCALILGFVISWAICPDGSWESYFRNGDGHYLLQWNPGVLPENPKIKPVPDVEGFYFGHHLMGILPNSLANIFWLLSSVVHLPNLDLGFLSKVTLLALVFLQYFWLFRNRQRTGNSSQILLVFLATLILNSELFLPFRWPYVDVQLLIPVVLAWPWLAEPRPTHRLLVAGLLGILILGRLLPTYTDSFQVLERVSLFSQLTPIPRPWFFLGSITILAATIGPDKNEVAPAKAGAI